MNTKKDTYKKFELATEYNKTENRLPDNYRSKLILSSLIKKSENISLAVHMISSLEKDHISLKEKACQKTIDAMDALCKAESTFDILSLSSAYDQYSHLMSFMNILYRLGSVSEMNFNILKDQVENLQLEIAGIIHSQQNKKIENKKNSFSLNDLFSFEEKNELVQKDNNLKTNQISFKSNTSIQKKEEVLAEVQKDISFDGAAHESIKVGYPNIKQVARIKDTGKKISLKKESQAKSVDGTNFGLTEKKDAKSKRQESIIQILGQKKRSSMNDICSLIDGCSSKTIQRDLNKMIEKGLVVKRGDRRWATYDLK